MDASYHEQHGCHDCELAFREQEFECPDVYYCTLDAPDRPLCGSIFMEEPFPPGRAAFSKAMTAWDDWCKGREVMPWGTCEKWKEKQS